MTTPPRDELSAFPCNPLRPESRCQEQCPGGDSPCERRDVYLAHIALRRAVLGGGAVRGGFVPAMAELVCRDAAEVCRKQLNTEAAAYFNALADVVTKL